MPKPGQGGRAGRLVDQAAAALIERRREGDRVVGAIDGRFCASDRHQRRSACRSERDEASLSKTARIIAEFARGVASVLREERDPEGLRSFAEALSNPVETRLRDAAPRIAVDCRRSGRGHDAGGADVSAPLSTRRDNP